METVGPLSLQTHPNYAIYQVHGQLLKNEVRELPADYQFMPCYKKSLWLKENGQPLPHTLVLPMVPNPDPYATFPDGIKDEKTPWKQNLVNDQQVYDYLKSLTEDQKKKISQINFQGGSELKGYITGTPEEDLDELRGDSSNSWIHLMDYDLVMLRITYSGLSDWAFKELMRAPFWKRGYVQFLDFEHNLEIFDEMFEVFNHEDTKDEDAPKPNLLKELYPYYENLKYLCLNWTRVSDDAMKALFSGPLVKNLVHLEMDGTYWNNTEEDSSIILFEKTNFTCLRYFTARHSNLMDQSFQNLMAEVGHTLEYLFIGNSLTLTLDAQFWANAVKRNQEKIKDKTSEIMCFRQLRVLDVSNIVRAAENILDSVATYCDTKRLKELRFQSLFRSNGLKLFENTDRTWDSIELVDGGPYFEEYDHIPQHSILSPMALYHIFYASKAGQDGDRDLTIGDRAKCITWSYDNITPGEDHPSGEKVKEDTWDELGVKSEIEVPRKVYPHGHLAYLVYCKWYVYKRKLDAIKIINTLKSHHNKQDFNFQTLISPAFFEPPAYDPEVKYDLNFYQFTNLVI